MYEIEFFSQFCENLLFQFCEKWKYSYCVSQWFWYNSIILQHGKYKIENESSNSNNNSIIAQS